jgi:hypothetical protein
MKMVITLESWTLDETGKIELGIARQLGGGGGVKKIS